jgi:CMP/dCMP kinase
VVAIDGPAGSGKSTLARSLAAALGLPYVNTGLMYRALTREALRRAVSLEDGGALGELLAELRFELSGDRPPALSVNGKTPDADLLSPGVEAAVSAVARHPEVRALMAAEQRRLGATGAVMEGRDIGSVVFPGADVKIFLVAPPEERAARRVEERHAAEGTEADPTPSLGPDPPEDLAAAMAARDSLDAEVNPFVPAPDAVPIDTSGRSKEEVLAEALALVRARLEDRP